MNYVFFNQLNKLRSGWRVAAFLAFFFTFAAIFRTVEEVVVSMLLVDGSTATILFFAINSGGLLFLALFFGGVLGKLFEDLSFKALGASFTKCWFRHLAHGVAVGGATLIFAVLVAMLFGGERFELNLTGGSTVVVVSLAVSLMIFGLGAAWEEALFRGYVFQTLTRSNLAWLAILMTSVFFGLVHLGNDNATAISTINTILAGIWFSLAYLKSRDLWFVWGLHLMWNWMQGAFFGIEVSGLTDIVSTPLLKEIDSGPTWLTGTTYGIEGGIACTVAIILSGVAIHFLPLSKAEKDS